jgi:hypothetical protein
MPGDDIHRPDRVPEALELLIARLGELRVVFGDASRATLAAVEQELRHAVAARDRGDPLESVAHIGSAMERVVRLAGAAAGDETAVAMRLVIDGFRTALTRGQAGDARRATEIMQQMAGARPRDGEG